MLIIILLWVVADVLGIAVGIECMTQPGGKLTGATFIVASSSRLLGFLYMYYMAATPEKKPCVAAAVISIDHAAVRQNGMPLG